MSTTTPASQDDVRELSRTVGQLAVQSAAIVERLDVVIEDNRDLKTRVKSLEDWRTAAGAFERGKEETKKSFWKGIKDAGGVVHAVWGILAAAVAWVAAGGKLPLH